MSFSQRKSVCITHVLCSATPSRQDVYPDEAKEYLIYVPIRQKREEIFQISQVAKRLGFKLQASSSFPVLTKITRYHTDNDLCRSYKQLKRSLYPDLAAMDESLHKSWFSAKI